MNKKEIEEIAVAVAAIIKDDNKEILNIEEAEIFLGVSKSWIYRLVSEKKVHYYRPFSSRLYFRRSELEALIFSNVLTQRKNKVHVERHDSDSSTGE